MKRFFLNLQTYSVLSALWRFKGYFVIIILMKKYFMGKVFLIIIKMTKYTKTSFEITFKISLFRKLKPLQYFLICGYPSHDIMLTFFTDKSTFLFRQVRFA